METLFARVVEVPVSQSTTRPNFITVILISEKKKRKWSKLEIKGFIFVKFTTLGPDFL